jgi:hypothetical protein
MRRSVDVIEQVLAAADGDRRDQQVELVDETVRHQ